MNLINGLMIAKGLNSFCFGIYGHYLFNNTNLISNEFKKFIMVSGFHKF